VSDGLKCHRDSPEKDEGCFSLLLVGTSLPLRSIRITLKRLYPGYLLF
jgi:hypothetical protein